MYPVIPSILIFFWGWGMKIHTPPKINSLNLKMMGLEDVSPFSRGQNLRSFSPSSSRVIDPSCGKIPNQRSCRIPEVPIINRTRLISNHKTWMQFVCWRLCAYTDSSKKKKREAPPPPQKTRKQRSIVLLDMDSTRSSAGVGWISDITFIFKLSGPTSSRTCFNLNRGFCQFLHDAASRTPCGHLQSWAEKWRNLHPFNQPTNTTLPRTPS